MDSLRTLGAYIAFFTFFSLRSLDSLRTLGAYIAFFALWSLWADVAFGNGEVEYGVVVVAAVCHDDLCTLFACSDRTDCDGRGFACLSLKALNALQSLDSLRTLRTDVAFGSEERPEVAFNWYVCGRFVSDVEPP